MFTFLVLAILIVLLVIVLMQLFKKSTPPPADAPGPDLANLKVTDARVGDVLSISGAGDNMTDLDLTVDRSTRFDLGARRTTLLSGLYRGERRVTVRLVIDEDAEVSIENDPRKLSLEDLGLSEDDLGQMDERQNPADSFEFDGKVWLYRRSREVKAWRDNQTQPTGFYYWEFQEQDGKRQLIIRKEEAEPFAVSVYTVIPASDVTVYRGKS
jgi:hypothetical protein